MGPLVGQQDETKKGLSTASTTCKVWCSTHKSKLTPTTRVDQTVGTPCTSGNKRETSFVYHHACLHTLTASYWNIFEVSLLHSKSRLPYTCITGYTTLQPNLIFPNLVSLRGLKTQINAPRRCQCFLLFTLSRCLRWLSTIYQHESSRDMCYVFLKH